MELVQDTSAANAKAGGDVSIDSPDIDACSHAEHCLHQRQGHEACTYSGWCPDASRCDDISSALVHCAVN